MSGIEIAGLVLGAIPLIISALEHYEDIIGPTKAFFKYGGELAHAIRELRNQHTLFEQSIEVLLRPITTDKELNEMIDNTKSMLWKNRDIEEELRKHLGRAYVSYMDTVTQIRKIMTEIASKLDNLSGAENLTQDGLEAIISRHEAAKIDGKLQKFDLSKRVKFTMKKKQIKHSLEELKNRIDTLDKFQEKADKISATDDRVDFPESNFTLALNIDNLRQNARSLYNVLSKAWCSTHSSHSAGLLLEQRFIKKQKRGKRIHRRKCPEPIQCNTDCFALSLLESSNSNTKKWLQAEIRVVEYQASHSQSSSTGQAMVSFAPTLSITAVVVNPDPALPHHNPAQLQIVTDICSILRSKCHPCIGFCLDGDGHLRGSYNVPRNTLYSEGGTTLEDILTKHPGAFSMEERYNLSIVLASSVLQLSQTPWLRDSWSKADIIFLTAQNNLTISKTGVDTKHPYLTTEHTQTPTLVRSRNGETNDSSKVLALGILLLEICCGFPIEYFLIPTDLGPNNQPNEISYLQAARRWVIAKETTGEFSIGFINAISYCLQCFMNPGARLADSAFSKTIEEKVLAPLDAEMSMLFGLESLLTY